jgi:hypothetical protein
MPTGIARTVVFGFVAGAVAFVIFHQGGFWVLTQAGLLKATTWSTAPTRPFGIPAVVSLAFWSGLWGIVAALVVPRLPIQMPAIVGWFLFAAIVPPMLVGWFIVAPLKGQPVGNGFHMPGAVLSPLVHGFWGIGMWLVMRLLHRTVRPMPSRSVD